ncbi:GNAT family N-acetyltransferase [Corynebacterium kefirresidentii]|uniref:GNAT family N-acetyltransferase n=1 Tax=Corynebacterium TaxID=1716 RepID=UPI001EF21619|nr:GNAT family N-acetyltransferase [Corynebacterium kefirresidentii]MCG7450512.1 GNAT family N-acetyltransferase [Corynebacterium kefirresidentii]MCG7452750.1 GNAT family N-acetyltransferase [Corynebacterium kefirresidentii]
METITRTDRLILIPLSAANIEETHKVYSDGRIWSHRPNGRFADIRTTRALAQSSSQSWEAHHFGPWAAYMRHNPSEFVGVGGAIFVEDGNFWDIKYRLRPAHWGSGFATEIPSATLKSIHQVDPESPITARVTTNHPAAIRVIEKQGLQQVWEGRRVGTEDNPDEPDVRVYSDRELAPETLKFIQQRP